MLRRPSGMTAFAAVWSGQLVSILATDMTRFALTIWVFQETGSATALGLVTVFFITPFLIFSPIAGAMVDRYNRKLMMMLSDAGAGVATIMIFLLHLGGFLEVWHLYAAAAITGVFNCFQWPAYSASITLMVPKQQLGRVNGMMSLLESGPGVLAPLLAGALLGFIGLQGILIIDMVTFVLAVGVLLAVIVPQPPPSEAGRSGQGTMLQEAMYGFRYIFARPSLLGLQTLFFVGNLFAGMGYILLAPMVLARTGNNELIFGMTQTAGALGGIAGGVIMSAWGGFGQLVLGVLLGWTLSGMALSVVGMGRAVQMWLPALFAGSIFGPLINGSNQALWQAKVAPDVQGRVFAARRLIAWFAGPVTPLIAGPLADFVFEPAMRDPNSGMAQALGWLVGTGPGSGMALIMIGAGICVMLVGIIGFFIKPIRHVEDLLPDHDAYAQAQQAR